MDFLKKLNAFIENGFCSKEEKEAITNEFNALEDDVKEGQKGLRKAVHYHFPQEFIRKGEIELNQEPAIAEFQLKARPIPEGE